ncbi:interferon-inducible GTPase 5-like isoform X1 [Mytilus galloprovincialis]|uniref:interferon-inducible GTPase 5-like isoform X1 n=1 Tax=Mytilus galloprovincialis TaxID=29158 RepID=UPI003F7C87C8
MSISHHSGNCPNCRQNINEGQRFCEHCGYKIEASRSTMICLGKMEDGNQCNGLLRNDASFCPNCGTRNHILVLFNVAQASASNMVTEGARSELLYTRSTDDEGGDIWEISGAVLENEAQASVSNKVVADNESLSSRSTDDEAGDIWNTSDAVLKDEAFNNPALYDEFYSDLESGGASTTEASIEEILNRWETEEVQFGIVGRSAMGKSTFINLLLNLSPTDPGHAKVGEGDCTTLIKIYEHPKFGSFKLVDFPGFGTLNMTKDQFLVKFNSVNLDYFFVFIDTVLMEEDIWLVKKLKERKIAYSFVRTKIDVIVDKARKNGTNEQEAIAQIRSKLEDTMARNDTLRGSKLFLISNFKEYFHYGDLIRLLIHITSLIPDGKVEALLFFLPLLTPELIELKCKTLKKRIKFVAVATGVIAAIPIPLVDFPVNIAIVTREVRRYIRILNLDQPYVKKVPGLKHPSLKDKTKIESIKAQFMKCLKLGAVAAVSQLDWVLPGIGSAIAGPAAIALIAHHLKSELEVLRVDAEVVYVYMLEHT